MKEMTFLLITTDCCGLWLASQVLMVKEVLYLCYNYASSQTPNPLAKIRAVLHPLLLLRSGPYIDRRFPYFPQYGIGILQMHTAKCDLPLWFLPPLFLSKLHPIWMSHSSNCSFSVLQLGMLKYASFNTTLEQHILEPQIKVVVLLQPLNF